MYDLKVLGKHEKPHREESPTKFENKHWYLVGRTYIRVKFELHFLSVLAGINSKMERLCFS